MSGIMKKLRNETERAKFEAGRALRLQREQGKLGQLQSQKKEHLHALGEAVWEMYQAGQVTDARLVAICTQIKDTQQDVATQEQIIEAIKQELPPEPPTCPQCGRDVTSSDAFCPGCGTTLAGNNPISSAVSSLPVPALRQNCPQCHKPVRSGAAFCPACGARITG
jgi:RNA polymerase subunit RPABC4/transcription elongation factor Spt4